VDSIIFWDASFCMGTPFILWLQLPQRRRVPSRIESKPYRATLMRECALKTAQRMRVLVARRTDSEISASAPFAGIRAGAGRLEDQAPHVPAAARLAATFETGCRAL
jgi:hypothetical protein